LFDWGKAMAALVRRGRLWRSRPHMNKKECCKKYAALPGRRRDKCDLKTQKLDTLFGFSPK